MQIAQSGTPGPVFVEFPIDTLYPYPLVKKETGLKVRKLAFLSAYFQTRVFIHVASLAIIFCNVDFTFGHYEHT